jgi:hypothetical protein
MTKLPGKATSEHLGKLNEPQTRTSPGKLPSKRAEHNVRTDFGDSMLGLRFPASREELVEQARAYGMDDQIVEVLRNMPERQYRSMDDVKKDLGGQV